MTALTNIRLLLSEAFSQKTTGLGLNADEAFIGLSDYGLFAEKMPPCLTSAGLSGYITTQMSSLLTEQDSGTLQKKCDRFVHSATRYQSMRDINIPRHMAVPHPESHLAQCLLIKRAWSEIKRHCSSHRPFSQIFVRKLRDTPRVFEMNYRGSERWDQEEQELRFQTGAQYVVHTDISKCFPSIYTHSIPWAMLGKPEAKRQRNDFTLAGNYLDKSCQITADKQTNGLHIGPHTSNIISEIILTKVDAALWEKEYRRVIRHIDDYRFFARDYEEAEAFIRELSMQLREYELHINEGKTRIVTLPQPAQEDWVRELNSFRFSDGDLLYSEVRMFLDLALRLVEETGKSSVLNYAIRRVPKRLNARAKQLFAREVVNLALRYPYLAPVLDKHLFEKHEIEDHQTINDFCRQLLEIGIQRIYPDAIAHALYYAIKFDVELDAERLLGIVSVNDCISLVLLWEYAERYELLDVQRTVRAKADELKTDDRRDADLFWLLIYQVWSAQDLRGNGQCFLADLKDAGFSFVQFNPALLVKSNTVLEAEGIGGSQ
jgi:hypothetical protein